MNLPRVNVILGQAGQGKSCLLQALLRDSRRLLVIDTCMEHAGLAPDAAIEDVWSLNRHGGGFRLSVCPTDTEDFEWLCHFAASQPSIDLAIDEYSVWYPAAQSQPCQGILMIVRVGRKCHQRIFLTTQSPGAITKQICGQAALWVFHMDETRDREYVIDRCGGTIDPLGLEPEETDEHGRIILARLARYYEGRRTDWLLHTPSCTISQK